VSTGDNLSRLYVIYLPPPFKQLIITGDLNYQLDKPDSTDVHQFSGLLESHGLAQNVRAATCIQGHTLDLVITREDSSILRDTPLVMDPFLVNTRGNSLVDHMAIHMKLYIGKS